MSETKTTHKIV